MIQTKPKAPWEHDIMAAQERIKELEAEALEKTPWYGRYLKIYRQYNAHSERRAYAEAERDKLRELIQQHADGLITHRELYDYGIKRQAAQAEAEGD